MWTRVHLAERDKGYHGACACPQGCRVRSSTIKEGVLFLLQDNGMNANWKERHDTSTCIHMGCVWPARERTQGNQQMQKQEAERAVGLQAGRFTNALGTSDQREGMMNHELGSAKTAVQLPGLGRAFRSERGTSLEAIIGGWLEEKAHRSPKTREAYRTTLLAFRQLLLDNGLDLLWKEDDFLPTIADYAQVFARTRSPQARRQGAVKPATQAQRLAILSSFYLYAIKRRHLLSGNPIDGVDRPNVQPYAQAAPLEQEEVEARLQAIDATTMQGKRDLALLAVLLATGRRVSEIASLQRRHLQVSGQRLIVTFERTKGDEQLRDSLPSSIARVLIAWLEAYYGTSWQEIPAEAPVWVNVYHHSH
jgi:site-specific recombinase XerD